MRKFLISTLAAAAATATIASTGAYADAAEDTAKARRAFYTLVGFEMGTLGAMAKGAMDYDAETAAQSAKDILTLTGLNTADYFAPGSSKDDLPGKTRALAKIWDDFPGLSEKGTAFYQAVVELNDVAGSGLDALRPAVGKLGGTCKACHDAYRADEF